MVYWFQVDLKAIRFPIRILAFLLLGVLSGCEGIEVEGASVPSTVSSPVRTPGTVGVTPTDTPISWSMTLSPTVPPSPTPTVLPLPTLTPFRCTLLRGRTEEMSFTSEAIREEVQILVHLPSCYDRYPDKAFPVLYLFHGWPLNEYHWDTLGIDELVDDWIGREIVGPFIVVMPGVSSNGLYVNSSGGSWSFEGMFVDELVPLIDRTYNTWRVPEGRAVGGISRGGVWAIEIAFRHQDLFGIVGGHSPALALNRPLPQYDPFLLIEDGVEGLRIYLDAGDLDWARASTVRLKDALLAQEADVIYQVHEGGHVDALWQGGLQDYVDFYALTWPGSFETLPPWEALPEIVPEKGDP